MRYSDDQNDNLLDSALALVGATVMLRRTPSGERSEYAVGELTGAYRSRSNVETSVTVGQVGIRVRNDDAWEIVTRPEPAGRAIDPGVHTAYLPESEADGLQREIRLSGADPTPFVTIRSIDGIGYLLHWPHWGSHPGRMVTVMEADPAYLAMLHALDFAAFENPEEWGDRVEFIGTEEATAALSKRLAEAASGPKPEPEPEPELIVSAFRWQDGNRVGHEPAVVKRRLAEDAWLVCFQRDGHMAGVFHSEIGTDEGGWAKLEAMPITLR